MATATTNRTPPAGAWKALARQLGWTETGRFPGIRMMTVLTTREPDAKGFHHPCWIYMGEHDGNWVFRGVRDCLGQTRVVPAVGGAR